MKNFVRGIESVGFAETVDDSVVSDDVRVAVILENLHDLDGFVDGFGREETLDEVGA